MNSTGKLYLCAAVAATAWGTCAFAQESNSSASNLQASVPAQSAAPQLTDEERHVQQARLKGAYDPDVDAFVANRDERVKPYYRALFVEGERNAVLNFDRVALVELERNNIKDATWALDQAANRINTIYAGDANAEKAKSIWNEESVKDFKGEPYERAMTFYYRGLEKLMRHDYENARANFKAAEQQTLMSEAETYKTSSFAALTYLSGWASHCAGDEQAASGYYSDAIKANAALSMPAAGDDLLMISEVGVGPTKTGEGQYHEQLKMAAGTRDSDYTNFSVMPASAKAADPEVRSMMASDISQESTMRDGRPVDTILQGKAQWKSGTSTAGTVSTMLGMGLEQRGLATNNVGMANMGAAAGLFGIVASIAADQMTPKADTRYWDTLPDALDVATAKRPKGQYSVTWSGVKADGTVVSAPASMSVAGGGKCSIAWVREKSALDAPASAPNADPDSRLSSDRLAQDAAFRATLLSDFTPAPQKSANAAPDAASLTASR
jgi:hypothetical protein